MTNCGQDSSSNGIKTNSDTLQTTKQTQTLDRCIYKNIKDVVRNKNVCFWANSQQDFLNSSVLNFDSSLLDTLTFGYLAGNCAFKFPFKIDKTKITVYWDTIIENNCRTLLIQTFKSVNKKYFGKPFMVLELANDTTLKASYPYPELMEKLNLADTAGVLFPKNYTATSINM